MAAAEQRDPADLIGRVVGIAVFEKTVAGKSHA